MYRTSGILFLPPTVLLRPFPPSSRCSRSIFTLPSFCLPLSGTSIVGNIVEARWDPSWLVIDFSPSTLLLHMFLYPSVFAFAESSFFIPSLLISSDALSPSCPYPSVIPFLGLGITLIETLPHFVLVSLTIDLPCSWVRSSCSLSIIDLWDPCWLTIYWLIIVLHHARYMSLLSWLAPGIFPKTHDFCPYLDTIDLDCKNQSWQLD